MRAPRHGRTYRRRVAVVLLFAMVGFLLPGCGGGGGEGPPPPQDQRLVTAVSSEGAGCLAVQHDGGEAWQQQGVITVPDNATQLVIASLPDEANPDLQGARITLTSPDGQQTITLQNGTISYTGLTPVDPSGATDQDAEDYIDALVAEMPANPTDDDWDTLMNRLSQNDPTMPQPSAALLAAVETHTAELLGETNAVVVTGSPSPGDGLLIAGPQAGNWQVEVSASAGAGAFGAMAWASAGLDGTKLRSMANALAGAAGTAQLLPEADGCTGCDPGCEDRFQQWSHPAPGTAQDYYIKGLKVAFAVLSWYIMRGAFTIAIGLCLDFHTVALSSFIAKEGFKVVCIYVVSRIARKLYAGYQAAENYALKFWYSVTRPYRWVEICYLGRWTGAGNDWKPTLSLEPGEEFRFSLVAANALMWCIDKEWWGKRNPSDTAKDAQWAAEPASLVTLAPYAPQKSWCLITAPDDPTVFEGNLIVTIDTQPAKATWPVTIEESRVYWLSGAPDANVGFGVDDNLDVFLTHEGSTTQIVNTGTGMSGTKGPFSFEAHQGDVLKFQVRDTYGHCSSLAPVYLRRGDNHSALAAPGFDEGCGHGGGDRGIRYTHEFTIPF